MVKRAEDTRKSPASTQAMVTSASDAGTSSSKGSISIRNLAPESREYLITAMKSMPDGVDILLEWEFLLEQR